MPFCGATTVEGSVIVLRSKNYQVALSVVAPVLIPVVNNFPFFQTSPQLLFGHHDVFKNAPVFLCPWMQWIVDLFVSPHYSNTFPLGDQFAILGS